MGNLRILLIGVASLILGGCATYSGNSMADPNDPWQAVNRPVFAVNDAFDQALFKPLAKSYNAITPEPIQDGVTNFFSNLNEIDNGTIMNRPAPKIAIDYWNLGSDASLRDVVLAVRADEAGHRDKNHDFADKI